MRAHVGGRGRSAAGWRAQAEGARGGRSERMARTRLAGRARGGQYAREGKRSWCAGGGAMHLNSVDRKCLQFRAPGSLSANLVYSIYTMYRKS